jgi:hypothetical protein
MHWRAGLRATARNPHQRDRVNAHAIEARLVRRHHVDHGRQRDVGSICTGGQVSGPRRETRISAIVYLNVYPRSKNRPASIGHILPKLLISLARPGG